MKPGVGLELEAALVDHGQGLMPVPVCPTCAATGKRCLRPSGSQSERWHNAREDALARQCRCETHCARWLQERAAAQRELQRRDQPALFEVTQESKQTSKPGP